MPSLIKFSFMTFHVKAKLCGRKVKHNNAPLADKPHVRLDAFQYVLVGGPTALAGLICENSPRLIHPFHTQCMSALSLIGQLKKRETITRLTMSSMSLIVLVFTFHSFGQAGLAKFVVVRCGSSQC